MKLFKKKEKLNNKGMALVMVIVAIGLVTLLVSVLLSISFINFQMKITEKKSKDTFYNSEVFLDQIRM